MRQWSEIRTEYVDENGVLHLDGWRTEDDNEQGTVIAWVLPNGAVYWRNPEDQFDEQVKEALKEAREQQAETEQ